ncbi:MAG: asparagine synthase (glutamine-hydrolyzing) [Lachnospiraceae bacterium]|nr:asparagine synthase (glutamine-hydrolyzing) [Lachnospiraceae bacterium]
MCGIAGFCNWQGGPQKNNKESYQDKLIKTIETMNRRMLHRGPDGGGFQIEEGGSLVLGHRRLSIVDLSPSGTQPMESHSGRFCMVFNGEIYNHKVLRQKLLEEGKVKHFRGTSDTEVLLELFEAYGVKEAIRLCKGMFAIALYDRREKTLFLLRDRVGEKPLYYGFVNHSFVFASELGCIAALENFSNPINKGVLPVYFIHGYIPAPYSVYEDIYKLEPGTILTIKAPFREYKMDTYWSMDEAAKRGVKNPFTGSEKEAAQELERRLKEAISGQMVADVPVGAFLSSGIDSTTIVALMQSLSSQPVRTFTIGVEEPEYNEANVAKQIAKHLGTRHTEMYISEEDAKGVIPRLAYMYGEPFADSSQIPTYLVSKLTRQHVTVSLSGDAGDELFCGYVSYDSIDRIWGKMKNIPYPVRKLVSSLVLKAPVNLSKVHQTKALLLGAKGAEELYELSNEEEPLAKEICLDKAMLPFKYTQMDTGFLKDTRQKIMLMDLKMYHPDDILVKVDRAGMAVSLESRIPMLDKDVVEFAWTLPLSYKYQNGVTKKILRNILYQYVPEELMDLPKRGFSIPVSRWLREPELKAWAESLIERKMLKQQGILDADVVWQIWEDYLNKGQWRIQIWYILMFQQWMCERIVNS